MTNGRTLVDSERIQVAVILRRRDGSGARNRHSWTYPKVQNCTSHLSDKLAVSARRDDDIAELDTYAPATVSQATRPPSGGVVCEALNVSAGFSMRSFRLWLEMVVLVCREVAVAFII